jgi:hypothetical protein
MVLACQGVAGKFSPKNLANFLAYELAVMSWYESRRSNPITKFTKIYQLFYQSDENPEETCDSAGGDMRWTRVLERLNYCVRESPGEMSAL